VLFCGYDYDDSSNDELEDISKTKADLSSNMPQDVRQKVENILDSRVPKWNEGINKSSINSRSSYVSDRKLDSVREKISNMTGQVFVHDISLDNGLELHQSFQTGKAQLAVNIMQGYAAYISHIKRDQSESLRPITNAAAHGQAIDSFRQLGLPEEEMGSIVSTGVGGTGNGAPEVIARYVRINRKIGNLRVRGSYFMATYNLDGTPFRIKYRWPEFKLDEKKGVKNRKEAIAELAETISQDFDEAEIESELVYRYDMSSSIFTPNIRVIKSNGNEQAADVFYVPLTK